MRKLCELEGLISEYRYLLDLKRSYDGMIDFIKKCDSTFCVDSFSFHSLGDVKDFVFSEGFSPSSDEMISLLSVRLDSVELRLKSIRYDFITLDIDCFDEG